DLVDGRRLDLLLGEAVPCGQSLQLAELDGLERAAEGVGEARVGVGASGRAQVRVDGAVEGLAGRVQVAFLGEGEARLQLRVGVGDALGDGIRRGLRGLGWSYGFLGLRASMGAGRKRCSQGRGHEESPLAARTHVERDLLLRPSDGTGYHGFVAGSSW